VNASGDANLDYLSDGLSESLFNQLSQLPHLKVIARNSSFKYRGENIDIQEVARHLGVQIVMGKVLQRGDSLSIGVEMVDARDNKQLWGEEYNRKTTDTLAVQQEIGQTIAEKLRLKLTSELPQ
jgi:adenylate cyclase